MRDDSDSPRLPRGEAVTKPFIVFTAEDFPFHRMDDCKNGCPENCHAVIAASRANAILNERGTRASGRKLNKNKETVWRTGNQNYVDHDHESLILGQREIEK